MKFKKTKIAAFGVLTLFLLYYIFSKALNLNPLFPEGAFFWCFTLSAYVLLWGFFRLGGSFASLFTEPDERGRMQVNLPSFRGMGRTAKLLLIIPWALFFLTVIFSSVFFHWKAYRDQLGEPEVRAFSSDVQVIDTSRIPIVDKPLAAKLADKKLGERPSLGSQVVLGEPTMQMVKGNLVWVVPLHHSGFFKWLTNLQGTPGYVVVSATNMNDVQYVDGFKIKYHPGSYLLQDLTRHIRFTGGMFTGLTDYSFEIDDEGNPYWVVTTYKNLRGFSLPEATGAIIVNASTGEWKKYSIGELPAWVDRVQPEDFLLQQIRNRGEYVHGFLNFSDKDKSMPSPGDAIVYNNGRCYLFTGLTSVGNDQSAIGFVMIDMVTKHSLLYQMNGATEVSAQNSAQGKVQHLGYYASFPIILNVDGQPSYFMTLKDKEGLVKQYAFVSVVNYSTVGTGETITSALRDYEKALRQDTGSSFVPEDSLEKQATGTVQRIASQYNGSETLYFLILEEYPEKIFTVSASVSTELPLTEAGDKVSLSYQAPSDGESSPILPCLAFDNLAFSQS